LSGIACQKARRFPNLKKITLWYHDYSQTNDISYDVEVLWDGMKILTILKDAGISLEYVDSSRAPFLGGWGRATDSIISKKTSQDQYE
jgi:hypothetical protein